MIAEGKRRGIPVAALVGAKEHALRQAAAGVDIIVAQGGEAGGHCGEVSTLVLVPEVVRALKGAGQDIPVLADYFLRKRLAGLPAGVAGGGISPAAMDELCRRPWPGNVRELRSAIEYAALLSRGLPIEPSHLPPVRTFEPTACDPREQLPTFVRDWTRRELLSEEARGKLHERLMAVVEPPLFQTVLEATQQNRAAAAEILGIHRQTLRKRLEESS